MEEARRSAVARREPLSAARWLHPSRSLPARISLFVFGATLVTSLTVTGISVQSIDSFLRDEIEQKFPSVLASATERLGLWYQQRELDVGVFAKNEILLSNLLNLDASGARGVRARAEVDQYLRYVLDGSPQYRALFVCDASGSLARWVGEELELPEAALAEAHEVSGVSAGAVHWQDGHRLQLLSASLTQEGGGEPGSLHAVVRMEAVREVLAGTELDDSWRLNVLDAGHRVIISTDAAEIGQSLDGPLPVPPAGSLIAEYALPGGDRVVGSHRIFGHFAWSVTVQVPYDVAFSPVVSSIRRILALNLAIVLTLALTAFRVALTIAQPIEALSEAARRISDGGDPSELPTADRKDEVGILAAAFRAMTTTLAANARELEESRLEVEKANESLLIKNEELQRASEVFEQLSITDGLTKLHNHRYFQDQLVKEVRRAERTGAPLALILADIDHFKKWNDELGHAAGDQILRQVAEAMAEEVRDTDLLARYGGEEFAVLAPETDLAAAVALAERLRAAIERTEFFVGLGEDHRPVSASFGVALFEGNANSFFEEADRALYAAKEGGRDCVVFAGEVPEA